MQCHPLAVGHGCNAMRLHGKDKMQCHSHTVGHGMARNAMRLYGKEKQMQCHSHTDGIKCNETSWSRKTDAVSLTGCWSWMKCN